MNPTLGETASLGVSASATNYQDIINSINMTAVEEHIRFLSSLETRATGYRGNDRAAEYIYEKFKELGFANVSYHEFSAVECIDHGANVTFLSDASTMKIYPMIPNGVVPSTTGPEGLTGTLVYLRKGEIEDLNGNKINGSIAIFDWESEFNWLRAVDLGAKALLFISDPNSLRLGGSISNAYYNWMRASTKATREFPLKIPRFYVREGDTAILMNHLGEEVHLVAQTWWENLTARNVLGFIEGTTYKKEVTIISASYDSYSDSPSYAPGAQEACGVAALLELAKYFSINPPEHSILFIAYGATYLGGYPSYVGAIEFINDFIDFYLATDPVKRALGDKIGLHFDLNLDTESDFIRLDRSANYKQDISSIHVLPTWYIIGEFLTNVVREVESQTGNKYRYIFTDTANEALYGQPIEWQAGAWYRRTSNAELTNVLAWDGMTPELGIAGYKFGTVDFNKFVGRPFDEISYVNFKNLRKQLEVVFCSLESLMNLKEALYEKWKTWTLGRRVVTGSRTRWASVGGIVAEWSKETAFYKPVPGAIVIIQQSYGTYNLYTGHPLMYRIALSDENGGFLFKGTFLAEPQPPNPLNAWVINPTTGDVLMAPDRGMHAYSREEVDPSAAQDIGFLVVFKCSTIAAFNVIDPNTLNELIDPTTGISLPVVVSQYGEEYTPLESQARWRFLTHMIVAIPPNIPGMVSVKRRPVERYPFIIITNASETNPGGAGYRLKNGEQYIVRHSTLKFASDAYILAEDRFTDLAATDPSELASDAYHRLQTCKSKLDTATEALKNYEYDKYFLNSNEAWFLAIESYGYARAKLEEASLVVPLIAAFLVPFTLLAEKLFFDLPGRKKTLSMTGVFGGFIFALYILHPGFSMSANPIMNIIGFSSIILIFPIVIIMIQHFTDFLKTLRRRALGVHEAGISRGSALIQSYSMSIENMRRRKLRTALLMVMVILMVVGLNSLVSISTITLFQKVDVPEVVPAYQGIFIRKIYWGEGAYSLGKDIYDYLNVVYGEKAIINARAWMHTIYRGNLRNALFSIGFKMYLQDKNYSVNTLLGLTVNEPKFTHVDQFLLEGRWFEPGENTAIILTESVANQLEAKIGDGLKMADTNFTIIGIIRDEMAYVVVDLDGEAIAPIRFNVPLPENPWNMHMHPEDFSIVPFQTLRLMGGEIPSISIKFDDPSLIEEATKDVSSIFPEYMIYSAIGEKVYLVSKGGGVTIGGLEYQMIPIVMVGLSILNMSLAVIVERRREMSIFSSVGLSPAHVSLIYLAENTVYAVVGSICGYVLSLALLREARIYLPFLTPNIGFSGFTVSVGLSIIAILASTVYPLLVVARLVTPSLERAWVVPTMPVGNLWEIPLPFFASSSEECDRILNFLREFMIAHQMEGAEGFTVSGISSEEGKTEEGNRVKRLTTPTRLYPYERGVAMNTSIVFTESPKEQRWGFGVVLERTRGSLEDWEKLGRNFLDDIRKQMLLWRSMKEEEKAKYAHV